MWVGRRRWHIVWQDFARDYLRMVSDGPDRSHETLCESSLCRDDVAEENLVHVFGVDGSTLKGSCAISVSPVDLSIAIEAD